MAGRGRPKSINVESPDIQDSLITSSDEIITKEQVASIIPAKRPVKEKPLAEKTYEELIADNEDEEDEFPERDIFDAIEAGEIKVHKVTVCDDCIYQFGNPVCISCVNYAESKRIKGV